jgi:ubiquinone/menaquinone biosynthesis C-methylase UbiE
MESWDKSWEKIFQTKEWGKYPPEELIRFIARNYYRAPDRKVVKILDVGCGTGAASWFIAREGFTVYGIDGSPTAIALLKERFKKEKLKGDFRVGDFIQLGFNDNFFDAVVDISSIQHNRPDKQTIIFDEIFRVLKPGGKLFSIMLNKRSTFGENTTHRFGDVFIHFFDESEIRTLLSRFQHVQIERSERTDQGIVVSHFITSAEK